MRPGAAGPVTSDAPGYCELTTLPLTKKLPSSSRVSGPPRVPAAALNESDAARTAKQGFMAGALPSVGAKPTKFWSAAVSIGCRAVRLENTHPTKGNDHVRKHHPASPRAARHARTRLSRLPRSRRHGEVAPAERFYGERPGARRAGRRHAEDVVHDLRPRRKPFLRRPLPRAQAERAPAL